MPGLRGGKPGTRSRLNNNPLVLVFVVVLLTSPIPHIGGYSLQLYVRRPTYIHTCIQTYIHAASAHKSTVLPFIGLPELSSSPKYEYDDCGRSLRPLPTFAITLPYLSSKSADLASCLPTREAVSPPPLLHVDSPRLCRRLRRTSPAVLDPPGAPPCPTSPPCAASCRPRTYRAPRPHKWVPFPSSRISIRRGRRRRVSIARAREAPGALTDIALQTTSLSTSITDTSA